MADENTPSTENIADRLDNLNKAYRAYQHAKTPERRRKMRTDWNTHKKWFADHAIPIRYVSIGDRYKLAPRPQDNDEQQ